MDQNNAMRAEDFPTLALEVGAFGATKLESAKVLPAIVISFGGAYIYRLAND